MASSYNTRSTTSAAAAATTTTTSAIRHFCIALTNNPRMLRGAEQALRDVVATATTATTTIVPTRQRTASASHQGASVPPPPPLVAPTQQQQEQEHQSQLLQSRSRIRPLRRLPRQVLPTEQQVPASTQPIQAAMTATERRMYEQEIEEDLKVQIQPILQNYLNKTKRSAPVNVFLDMTSMIQF